MLPIIIILIIYFVYFFIVNSFFYDHHNSSYLILLLQGIVGTWTGSFTCNDVDVDMAMDLEADGENYVGIVTVTDNGIYGNYSSVVTLSDENELFVLADSWIYNTGEEAEDFRVNLLGTYEPDSDTFVVEVVGDCEGSPTSTLSRVVDGKDIVSVKIVVSFLV